MLRKGDANYPEGLVKKHIMFFLVTTEEKRGNVDGGSYKKRGFKLGRGK